MAKSKHNRNKKLNTRVSFVDTLFLDRRIRGCEVQLLKIENKLTRLHSKTGLWKLIYMKEIEQLTRSQNDYKKLLKNLNIEKAKQMNRTLVYCDAMEDIKEGFDTFASTFSVPKK